ncbi:hypothetical protein [Helicobacter burdigaliensis]|uniref:hypothetical protein n=1 Tax=Helicobacter burdigaliensis TaxID=2315334 RepID=UPI000EF69728|nr:hypothetical protein [Helicobacter burdigaliensis]
MTYIGGFAGYIDNGTFSNIVLNNIGNISVSGSNAYVGGFVGRIYGNSTFKNIYIYFKEGATITVTNDKGNSDVGKFVGYAGDDSGKINATFNNINLYHADSQFADMQFAGNTTDYENKFTHAGKTFNDFKTAILEEDAFKDDEGNPITIYEEKDDKGNTYFTFIDESNMGNDGDNGNGDNGDNNDSNFIDENHDGLTDMQDKLTGNDFSSELVKEILKDLLDEKLLLSLEVDKLFIIKEGKATLNQDYLKTILSKYKDDEALAQSINFLLAFYGEEVDNDGKGLGNLLADRENNKEGVWTNLKNRVEQIKNSKKELEDFIKGNNHPNYAQGGLLGLMNFFAEWKDKYELYTSGLAKEEEMKSLEKWFKSNANKLKEYQALLEDKILKEFPFANIDDNTTVKGSLTFSGGEWIANLKEPEYNNNGGEDQTITTPLKDINSSLLNKEKIVLIKPAEGEKEALDEEKGTLNSRTCVVSENFKTNNPCMAERI